MASIFSSKKASELTVTLLIIVAIGLLIFSFVGIPMILKARGGLGAISAPLSCTSDFKKCACLFDPPVCPTASIQFQYSSDCPPDNHKSCGDNLIDFQSNLKKIRAEHLKDEDKNLGVFGTCCGGNFRDHYALRTDFIYNSNED